MATNLHYLLHLMLTCKLLGVHRISGFPDGSYIDTSSHIKNNSEYIIAPRNNLVTALDDTDRVMRRNDTIIFPSDDSDDDTSVFTPDPNSFCNNLTFCEDAPNYPSELVDVALKTHTDLKLFSGIQSEADVVNRFNFQSEDVPLCESYEKIVYPKVAQNKDREWLFIINQGDFKQNVRVEICGNENNECSLIDGFAEGYKTICKQKYIYRQLVAVSSIGKIKSDLFRFPTSCCCHIKFTGNPLFRIRMSNKTELSNPNIKRKIGN